MEAPGYVLALTSVMDTEEGLERLIQALEGIDTVLDQENGAKNGIHGKIIPSFEKYPEKLRPRQKMSIAQAMESEMEERDLERSAEEISGEFAYLYPPGIPLLAPGEVISREFIKRAGRWQEQGLELQGLADHSLRKIKGKMGKIFYIMGKSSSGKDTIYKRLLEDPELELRNIILYTTRPMRQGEQPGREYYFVNEETFREYEEQGKIIEARTYQTVYGPWIYFTADDGQIQMEKRNYLGIGTLESYICMKEYFGEENLCPLYIEVEDGERLKRAIHREELQTEPKYAEMCRRFLADEEDFSEENLKRAGIVRRFQNMELESCVNELKNCIQKLQ